MPFLYCQNLKSSIRWSFKLSVNYNHHHHICCHATSRSGFLWQLCISSFCRFLGLIPTPPPTQSLPSRLKQGISLSCNPLLATVQSPCGYWPMAVLIDNLNFLKNQKTLQNYRGTTSVSCQSWVHLQLLLTPAPNWNMHCIPQLPEDSAILFIIAFWRAV